MNKLISVATFLMAASAPVLGADFEPNAAVDQQPPPSNSIIVTKAHWFAPRFSVKIWDYVPGRRRNRDVTFRRTKVGRDEFFAAISSALELTPEADAPQHSEMRTEGYLSSGKS